MRNIVTCQHCDTSYPIAALQTYLCGQCGAPLPVTTLPKGILTYKDMSIQASTFYREQPPDYMNYEKQVTTQHAEFVAQEWTNWHYPRVGELVYFALASSAPTIAQIRLVEQSSYIVVSTPRLPLPISLRISPILLQTLHGELTMEVDRSAHQPEVQMMLRYDIAHQTR